MNFFCHSIELGGIRSRILRRSRHWFVVFSAPLFYLLYRALSFSRYSATGAMAERKPEGGICGCSGRPKVDLVLCVVAGPGQLSGILDILDSAKRYLDGSYRIILVDDSCTLRIWWAIRNRRGVDYIRNCKCLGIEGLYRSLLKAYLYALKNYRFEALLKLDTDAIITGKGLIHDIRHHFATHPKTGMLGSYRVTCLGIPRDFTPLAEQFQRNLDSWKGIIERAKTNGYELGEHVEGGAYVLSRSCLLDMQRAGYLSETAGGSYVSEDGIFSLLARALGYTIDDFACNGPFAISWKGLPITKEDVVAQAKKVIHSVKFTVEDLEIREYFRRLRQQ